MAACPNQSRLEPGNRTLNRTGSRDLATQAGVVHSRSVAGGRRQPLSDRSRSAGRQAAPRLPRRVRGGGARTAHRGRATPGRPAGRGRGRPAQPRDGGLALAHHPRPSLSDAVGAAARPRADGRGDAASSVATCAQDDVTLNGRFAEYLGRAHPTSDARGAPLRAIGANERVEVLRSGALPPAPHPPTASSCRYATKQLGPLDHRTASGPIDERPDDVSRRPPRRPRLKPRPAAATLRRHGPQGRAARPPRGHGHARPRAPHRRPQRARGARGRLRRARSLRVARLPGLPEHLQHGRERHPHRRGLPRHRLRVPRRLRAGRHDLRRADRVGRPRAAGRPERRRALGGHRRRHRRRPPRPRHRGAHPQRGGAQLRRRARHRDRRAHRRAAASLRGRLLAGRRRGRLPARALPRGLPDRGRRGPRLHGARRRVGRRGLGARRARATRHAYRPRRARDRGPRRWSPSSRAGRSRSRCAPRATSSSGSSRAYEEHPFPVLREAGIPLTLGSDDPPYFGASVGGRIRDRP